MVGVLEDIRETGQQPFLLLFRLYYQPRPLRKVRRVLLINKNMKTYEIKIVDEEGGLFDSFIVLATEFSQALYKAQSYIEKAQSYIEIESNKKINKGITLEIGCIERMDDIREIAGLSGKFIVPTFN